MKGVLVVVSVFLWANVFAQESILSARQRPAGSVVTVQGVVLNGAELGDIRYIQDETGGLAIYPGSGSPGSFSQVTRGNEIRVTGVLTLFHGLLEINPVLSWQKITDAVALPAPLEISPGSLSFHDQGKLIRIPCVRFMQPSGVFESGDQSFYSTDGNRSDLYLEQGQSLINTPLPDSAVVLTGIASFYDGWRILIRSADDISQASCFHILPVPQQSDLTTSGFDLQWQSNQAGSGFVLATDEDGITHVFETGINDVLNAMTLTGLEPAMFYEVTAGSRSVSGDTALYPPVVMTTASESSGEIQVYFNQHVDASFSNGSAPDGTTFSAMINSVMDVINGADETIDCAIYNSNRSDIIAALTQAHQRGVRVRFIADADQSNGALSPLPQFPVFFRSGDGIMHNKFLVADADNPDNAIVWTGSTNHSTNQLSWDPNNTLVIHDQALAKAYVMEFEEMWGGSGAMPNALHSRTGSAKADQTPHLFNIGGREVELFFSPSDQTNSRILAAILSAEQRLDVGLLLLTRFDLTAAMTARHDAGVAVRVIVDDEESSALPLHTLVAAGVPATHHDFNAIFHHKYAIIDEGTSHAHVLTGSHNWTTSATTINDENTLIIHDPDITNIYRQEFEARWKELVPTSTRDQSNPILTGYPNPASEFLCVNELPQAISYQVYSVAGIPVLTQGFSQQCLDVSDLATGAYYMLIRFSDGQRAVVPFVKE